MKPVNSGKTLAGIVAGVEAFQFFDDSAETSEQCKLVADFLQQMRDWGDYLGDLDIGERVEAEFNINEALSAIRKAGWSVYGLRSKREATLMGHKSIFDVGSLAVVRGNPPVVILDGNQVVVRRV